MKEFVSHLEDKIGAGQFFVGEVWLHEITPYPFVKKSNENYI